SRESLLTTRDMPSGDAGQARPGGSLRDGSGVPGLGVRKGLADEGRLGPDADHADLYPGAHRGARVGLLCDTDGRAAASHADRSERKARARDPAAQLFALLERRGVDEDVPRSLVAAVGVVDDHLYLVAGHVDDTEVSNFVTEWSRGFVWQAGDFGWRRRFGSGRPIARRRGGGGLGQGGTGRGR